MGWAAENEDQYGVGDVARGLGKVGSSLLSGMKAVNSEYGLTNRAAEAIEVSYGGSSGGGGRSPEWC